MYMLSTHIEKREQRGKEIKKEEDREIRLNHCFIQQMCAYLCVSLSLHSFRILFKSIYLDNSCFSALAPAQ